MDEHEIPTFPLVDQYMGIRMEVDFGALRPGRVTVVESSRRLRKEQSYGFVHALWWMWLEDGRSAASVPPGAGEAVSKMLKHIRGSEQLFDSDLAEQLKGSVNDAFRKASLKEVDRVLCSVGFACNASLLRRHRHGDCRCLIDESVPPAEGLGLPIHCFPNCRGWMWNRASGHTTREARMEGERTRHPGGHVGLLAEDCQRLWGYGSNRLCRHD